MKKRFICVTITLIITAAAQGYAEHPDMLRSNPQAITEIEAGTRSEASAAWWGFDPEDATNCLQAAIDSKAARVLVPYTGAPWVTRPITLRSDLEICFEPGVTVLAKKGEFKGKNDSLFSARNCANIVLTGYGARLRMNKPDYQGDAYEKAEWRMCLNFRGCGNIRIEGLSLESSGGDGIYLGTTGEQPWCEDVIIRNVTCADHHRQGVSVISAKNLLIENCVFSDTDGTAPQAGIDLEPNNANEKLINVVVRNCIMENNSGAGMLVYLKPMRSTSEPVSILFENCHVRSGKDQGIAVGAVGDDGPGGWIEFRNCTVENTRYGGAYVYDKSAKSAVVRFVNCKWSNTSTVAKRQERREPILINLRRESITKKQGGIFFDDCVIFDSFDRPALKTEEDQGEKGAVNIRGRILRRGPGEARADISPGSAECDLEVSSL
ncbi:MAG TPA: hypothetical protein ENN29_14075 [Candidatus Hydrogenedentes bacterium]|nr:hypothetical protein [Candidatus Hydrogenedentota bacterium]